MQILEIERNKPWQRCRVIQLGPDTLAALRDHQLAQNAQRHALGVGWVDQGWMFPSSIGTPLDLRNLFRDFKEVLKAAGLPDIRFHDLRHTAASIMLQRNVPVFTVSKILGHAKPSTTLDIYRHPIPGALALAAQAMEDALTPVAMPINPESYPATPKSGANKVQI